MSDYDLVQRGSLKLKSTIKDKSIKYIKSIEIIIRIIKKYTIKHINIILFLFLFFFLLIFK